MRIDELKRRVAERDLDEGMPAELRARIARAKARGKRARALARWMVWVSLGNGAACTLWAVLAWQDFAQREWVAWWLVAFSFAMMFGRARVDRAYLAAYFEVCEYESGWRTEQILAMLREPA